MTNSANPSSLALNASLPEPAAQPDGDQENGLPHSHPFRHPPRNPSSPPQWLGLLDPRTIEVGNAPNRLPDSYEDESFEQLSMSILEMRGNQQPIHVRQLSAKEIPANSIYQYRLISGSRRLRACEKYGLQVRAIVESDVTGDDELVQRLVENHSRAPLSPYELGLQLKHIVVNNPHRSLRSLSKLVGIDVAIVQKAMDIASLPAEVVNAFATPAELQYRHAKPLKDAVQSARDAVVNAARALAPQKLATKDLVQQLVYAARQAASGDAQKEGVEPFNTPPVPTTMTTDDRRIGQMAVDKQGHLQIQIEVPLTGPQQAALQAQVEAFIRRKVWRLPAASKSSSPSDASSTKPASDAAEEAAT